MRGAWSKACVAKLLGLGCSPKDKDAARIMTSKQAMQPLVFHSTTNQGDLYPHT